MLAIGTKIPNFSALNQDGVEITNLSLMGKWSVLYFYPRNETPGCTMQACSLRDSYALLQAKGIAIYGISPDTVNSHKKFAEHHELPFTLLSDPKHELAQLFEVWVEKSMYGKKYLGVERSTYIIDSAGTIVAAFPKVKPIGHAQFLLKEFEKLF